MCKQYTLIVVIIRVIAFPNASGMQDGFAMQEDLNLYSRELYRLSYVPLSNNAYTHPISTKARANKL